MLAKIFLPRHIPLVIPIRDSATW